MSDVHIHYLQHDDPAGADAMVGKFADETMYDLLVRPEDGETLALKPDGTPLFKLLPGVLDLATCERVKGVFRPAATLTDNRGAAAGGERIKYSKVDGRPLNFNRSVKKVHSGIAGYMDANAKQPHCRVTAYTRQHTGLFMQAEGFVRTVDEVFHAHMPDRHEAQRRAAMHQDGDWSLFGTSFSTITINRNFRTACHRDAGDYKQGFGVLAALITGEFSGGVLVFPRYRAAVHFGTGDVLLADVHEVHGNTPFVGRIGRYERISLVFYYREHLLRCGSAEEELAKSREWGSRPNG